MISYHRAVESNISFSRNRLFQNPAGEFVDLGIQLFSIYIYRTHTPPVTDRSSELQMTINLYAVKTNVAS